MRPVETARTYRIYEGIYLLGTFENGVTILAQQRRALNLVWSLIKTNVISDSSRVAVIGGGVAGLTVTAALLERMRCDIWLFEKRPVLCPLQHGSDTRWVHPNIYEWPSEGSEFPVAELPILNWRAGRASDVVVEIVSKWEATCHDVQYKTKKERLRVVLDAKYLKLDEHRTVEWVQTSNGQLDKEGGNALSFDAVILAIGFGDEKSAGPIRSLSYWRNETFGQPHLQRATTTFLISGSGDGGLIDLFRVKIRQFRQDRILDELFHTVPLLVNALKEYKEDQDRAAKFKYVFKWFRALEKRPETRSDFAKVLKRLSERLRNDTTAILHVFPEAKSFDAVFRQKSSFQNKLLLFLLYRLGAFVPCQMALEDAIRAYQVDAENVIIRHGTERPAIFYAIASEKLGRLAKKRLRYLEESSQGIQSDAVLWPGGFFKERPLELGDRAIWRREFVPAATDVIGSMFLGPLSEVLRNRTPNRHFRLTLHRSLFVGQDIYLQQICKYFGNPHRLGEKGRVFTAFEGIIGYAFLRQAVVRAVKPHTMHKKTYRAALLRDSQLLGLTTAQAMSTKIQSLLAVPFIYESKTGSSCPLILYADAEFDRLFDDATLTEVLRISSGFAAAIDNMDPELVSNFPMSSRPYRPKGTGPSRFKKLKVIRPSSFDVPRLKRHASFNFAWGTN